MILFFPTVYAHLSLLTLQADMQRGNSAVSNNISNYASFCNVALQFFQLNF